jgi:regulatory protein
VELAAATRLLARRARTLQREDDPRRRHQKAYALLARYGFTPDVCRGAVLATLEVPPGLPEGDT